MEKEEFLICYLKKGNRSILPVTYLLEAKQEKSGIHWPLKIRKCIHNFQTFHMRYFIYMHIASSEAFSWWMEHHWILSWTLIKKNKHFFFSTRHKIYFNFTVKRKFKKDWMRHYFLPCGFILSDIFCFTDFLVLKL